MGSGGQECGATCGKIAFITGTAGGQGREAARLFAAEGACIIGCDVNAEGAEETAEIIRETGGEISSFSPVDLGDVEAAQAWIERGIAEVGGIDILYNNASTPRSGFIGDLDPADWAFTIRNELDLIMWTTQAAWPHLIDRGGGSIINIASVAGHRGSAGAPGSPHTATKGAVIAVTRQFAAEGCEHRIRANSISPGFIVTPGLRAAVAGGWFPPQPMPLGRLGRPEDVVSLALYLGSTNRPGSPAPTSSSMAGTQRSSASRRRRSRPRYLTPEGTGLCGVAGKERVGRRQGGESCRKAHPEVSSVRAPWRLPHDWYPSGPAWRVTRPGRVRSAYRKGSSGCASAVRSRRADEPGSHARVTTILGWDLPRLGVFSQRRWCRSP